MTPPKSDKYLQTPSSFPISHPPYPISNTLLSSTILHYILHKPAFHNQNAASSLKSQPHSNPTTATMKFTPLLALSLLTLAVASPIPAPDAAPEAAADAATYTTYPAPAGGYKTYPAPAGGYKDYPAPAGGYKTYPAPAGGYKTYAAPSGGYKTYGRAVGEWIKGMFAWGDWSSLVKRADSEADREVEEE